MKIEFEEWSLKRNLEFAERSLKIEFESLKLEKLKKGKLCSFCKRLLGEKVLKDMLLKALKLKNPQKSKLCSFSKPLTW